MLRELRHLEELRERGHGLLGLQLAADAAEVLVRRLGWLPRQPVHGQRLLHAGIGRHDRPARVRIAPEIVDRLVKSVPSFLNCSGVRASGRSRRRSTRTATTMAATMRPPIPMASGQYDSLDTVALLLARPRPRLHRLRTRRTARHPPPRRARARSVEFRRMTWPASTAITMISPGRGRRERRTKR